MQAISGASANEASHLHLSFQVDKEQTEQEKQLLLKFGKHTMEEICRYEYGAQDKFPGLANPFVPHV